MEADKKKALAQFMGVNVKTITVSDYDDDTFIVNSKPHKFGTSPQEYIDRVNDFKSLLNKKQFKLLANAIGVIETLGYIHDDFRNDVYKEISEALDQKKRWTQTQQEARTRIIISCLYVSNVLFWLLDTKDTHNVGNSYRIAWKGKKPKDIRREGTINEGEYLVLTDSEADKRYDEYLDNYVDEIIMPEIPDHVQMYVDEEAIKRDLEINGSRGSCLAQYDGNEKDITINDETFYIYRIN